MAMTAPAPTNDVEAFAAQLLPYTVRMDLTSDPAFVKKYGKKVKAAGGHYSEARGHQDTRFVYLPCEAVDLINAIWKEFANNVKGTMVAQSVDLTNNLPAWVTVQNVSKSSADPAAEYRLKLAKSLLYARERNIYGADAPVTQAEKDAHEAALAAKKAAVETARREEAEAAVNALAMLCMTEEGRESLVRAALSETLGGALARLAKTAGAH